LLQNVNRPGVIGVIRIKLTRVLIVLLLLHLSLVHRVHIQRLAAIIRAIRSPERRVHIVTHLVLVVIERVLFLDWLEELSRMLLLTTRLLQMRRLLLERVVHLGLLVQLFLEGTLLLQSRIALHMRRLFGIARLKLVVAARERILPHHSSSLPLIRIGVVHLRVELLCVIHVLRLLYEAHRVRRVGLDHVRLTRD
jgi:hypothetical protein